MKVVLAFIYGAIALFSADAWAQQVNSGSNGSDGAFNPTASVVIDMADHPDGIYQYTSVNIPAGVTVTFIPNAGNKPVVWLVQGSCVINSGGRVDVSSGPNYSASGAPGGPGGFRGGICGASPTPGQGPGGGAAADIGSNASYGTVGESIDPTLRNADWSYANPGATYGNPFLIPLIGGSGGGGSRIRIHGGGSGGGGGAMLIAANGEIAINGNVAAMGCSGWEAGGGSGGAIRLITPRLSGIGRIDVSPAILAYVWLNNGGANGPWAGQGRVRLDVFDNQFGGTIAGGSTTQGFQPIIIPAAAQGIQLSVASIGGAAVPASPSGVLANPDVIIAAQQVNPIPVVVNCSDIPLNTAITLVVHPANGSDVQAVGINNVGNTASSTATIPINMPRGGGIIYAKCVSGVAGLAANAKAADLKTKSLAQTGWTADGERFSKMEITAAIGGSQRIAYITESGKRYSLPAK